MRRRLQVLVRSTPPRRSLVLAMFSIGCWTQPAHADWTLGLYLGAAHTQSSSIELKLPVEGTDLDLQPVRYRSESLDPPLYYAVRAGAFPHDGWFGLEGELIHLKVVAHTTRAARVEGELAGEPVAGPRPLSSIVQRFSITHGVNLLLVNAVVRRRLQPAGAARPRWIVTARLGAGASAPHTESVVGGVVHSGYEWGAFSAQAAAGIEVRLTEHLYASGEYKLTHTAQNVSVANGSARTPLTTHHVLAGLTVHLGATARSGSGQGAQAGADHPSVSMRAQGSNGSFPRAPGDPNLVR
jgi:hypothetical protein